MSPTEAAIRLDELRATLREIEPWLDGPAYVPIHAAFANRERDLQRGTVRCAPARAVFDGGPEFKRTVSELIAKAQADGMFVGVKLDESCARNLEASQF